LNAHLFAFALLLIHGLNSLLILCFWQG